MKDQRVYLRHMLECIDAIRSYTAQDRERFLSHRMTTKAVLRELQELAESALRLDPELKARRSEIPWRDIAGFRNVLVHDYLGLSLERVWEVVERDLGELRLALEALLQSME